MSKRRSLETRLWDRVDRRGPEECWPWLGGTTDHGYGRITFRDENGDNHWTRASRAAWIVTFGDPGELLVCHRCDNPSCCNPAHLFLGTDEDNHRDMAAKGRGNTAKLAPESIPLLRDRLRLVATLFPRRFCKSREMQRLAHLYGVTTKTLWDIHRGLTWKDVA